MALVHSACYQQTLHRYHERKIRGRTLEVGDLMLRRTQSTKDRNKLAPPWEGPYTIAEVVRPGTYRLKDNDGNILTNTWNIEQKLTTFPRFLPNAGSYSTPAGALSARVARGTDGGTTPRALLPPLSLCKSCTKGNFFHKSESATRPPIAT
jgi:hypothetical protein